MADYAVVGFKGSGKGLQAVSKIQDAVNQNRRVATNLDIYTEYLVSNPENSTPIIRLPDYPRFEDFEAIGYGYEKADNEKIDESKFGIIVLDEISIWMNSRNWNDKSRLASVSWLRQARKFRWHVYYLAQSVDSVDNQTRELFEHVVECKRTDRAYIPLVGRLLNVFNENWGKLPRVHKGIVTYKGVKSVVDAWILQGPLLKSIYKSYDTEQVFLPDDMITESGKVVDMRASYSILPAKYINAWYNKPEPKPDTKTSDKPKSKINYKLILLLAALGLIAWWCLKPEPVVDVPTVKTEPVNVVPQKVIGTFISGTVKTKRDRFHIDYSYVFYGSDNEPFYPEDWGYAVVARSMCSAEIVGDGFSYPVTCGGRKGARPIEPNNGMIPTDKVFDISKINPFTTNS